MSNYIRLPIIFGIASLTVVLAGCTAGRLDVRGDSIDPVKLAGIKVGQQTRADVAEILGSPSSIAAFDNETWYYISKRTETTAFFEPEIKDRKVVILQFDKKGLVSDIKTLGKADGSNIVPVERETPTVGNKIGFLEQILSNLGRFSK